MLRFTGFDACIVGYTDSWSGSTRVERIIYSAEKIIETLMSHSGMSEEEAVEYLEFNMASAYVGEETPIILYPKSDYEDLE